jgi:GTPase SAR1 family protein
MSSLKIIVMGVGGVGKSAITNRFVLGRWIEKASANASSINEPKQFNALIITLAYVNSTILPSRSRIDQLLTLTAVRCRWRSLTLLARKKCASTIELVVLLS